MPLARVVSFDGVSSDRMAEMQREMEGSERPDDVPAKEIIVLHDPEAEKSLVVVFFDTDDDYQRGDAALSAKAANPNAAKVFIEYLCSSEGQKKVAETGEFVLHPGIYPSLKGAEKVTANMVFMDNPSGEQLTKLQSEFRQIFLVK